MKPVQNEYPQGCFPDADQLLLLKAALKKGEEAARSWQEWNERHSLDDHHPLDVYRLFPMIYENLSGAGVSLPKGMEGAFKKTFFTNGLLIQHLIKTQARLEERVIPCMVLKGVGMILAGVYPRQGCRFQFDYDLLVPFEQKMPVTLLFEQAGYRAEYLPEDREAHLRNEHSTNFTHPEMMKFGSFDLHWLPLALHKHRRITGLYFREKVEVQFNGVRFFTPPPELFLLHTMVHGLRSEHTSHTQWICDAAMILERTPGFDWKKFARFSEELQTGFFVKKGLSYLRDVIGVEFSPEAQAVIQSIRHSAIEPKLFAYFNQNEHSHLDQLRKKLHDERQLFPEKSLPVCLWRVSSFNGEK